MVVGDVCVCRTEVVGDVGVYFSMMGILTF